MQKRSICLLFASKLGQSIEEVGLELETSDSFLLVVCIVLSFSLHFSCRRAFFFFVCLSYFCLMSSSCSISDSSLFFSCIVFFVSLSCFTFHFRIQQTKKKAMSSQFQVSSPSSAGAQENRVTVKCTFNNDLRRIPLINPNFQTLKQAISESYHLKSQTFKLRYVDDEGDEVLFSSDQELQEALSCIAANQSSNKILRVSVELKEAKAIEFEQEEEEEGKKKQAAPAADTNNDSEEQAKEASPTAVIAAAASASSSASTEVSLPAATAAPASPVASVTEKKEGSKQDSAPTAAVSKEVAPADVATNGAASSSSVTSASPSAPLYPVLPPVFPVPSVSAPLSTASSTILVAPASRLYPDYPPTTASSSASSTSSASSSSSSLVSSSSTSSSSSPSSASVAEQPSLHALAQQFFSGIVFCGAFFCLASSCILYLIFVGVFPFSSRSLIPFLLFFVSCLCSSFSQMRKLVLLWVTPSTPSSLSFRAASCSLLRRSMWRSSRSRLQTTLSFKASSLDSTSMPISSSKWPLFCKASSETRSSSSRTFSLGCKL